MAKKKTTGDEGEPEERLVYVEYGTERDPPGALVVSHPDELVLERSRDRVLIDASLAVENEAQQGIVVAYLGVDCHWHFLRHATKQEVERARKGRK